MTHIAINLIIAPEFSKMKFLKKNPTTIDIKVAIIEFPEIKHFLIKIAISLNNVVSSKLFVSIISFFPQKIIYKLKLIKKREDNTLVTIMPQISHFDMMYINRDKNIALDINDI